MHYEGLRQAGLHITWHGRVYQPRLDIPDDSKVIALTMDKPSTDRDGTSQYSVYIYYLKGRSEVFGVDLLLIHESCYDHIDSTKWEYVASAERKGVATHLFRKIKE